MNRRLLLSFIGYRSFLSAEGHTTHRRAQAVSYLRMNGIRPPKYTPL